MPRIAIRRDQLTDLRDDIFRKSGMNFDTKNDGQIFAMLKHLAEEESGAEVTIVFPKGDRYLVTCNAEFLAALQSRM